MNSLSEKELDAFSDDARVWVVLDKDNSETYLLFPVNLNWDLAVVAFVEKEDAEHMVRLLETNDEFKKLNLEVDADSLKDLRAGAKTFNQHLSVWDHNTALEFFTRYPDLLDGYKG